MASPNPVAVERTPCVRSDKSRNTSPTSVVNEAAKVALQRSLRDEDVQDLDKMAYLALAKDPLRYRGSQESLLRRVSQVKTLYTINTVVDINKLVSLESNLLLVATIALTSISPSFSGLARRASRTRYWERND